MPSRRQSPILEGTVLSPVALLPRLRTALRLPGAAGAAPDSGSPRSTFKLVTPRFLLGPAHERPGPSRSGPRGGTVTFAAWHWQARAARGRAQASKSEPQSRSAAPRRSLGSTHRDVTAGKVSLPVTPQTPSHVTESESKPATDDGHLVSLESRG